MVTPITEASAAQLTAFQQRILTAQNQVRAQVHEPPLQWSSKLAAVAQDWANRLIKNGTFLHRTGSPYGENLYMDQPGPATPEDVVRAWAAEAANYRYDSNTCRGLCGHYTQIVWRDTTQVGCAVSRGSGREVWVCNYYPPGNYVGRKPY